MLDPVVKPGSMDRDSSDRYAEAKYKRSRSKSRSLSAENRSSRRDVKKERRRSRSPSIDRHRDRSDRRVDSRDRERDHGRRGRRSSSRDHSRRSPDRRRRRSRSFDRDRRRRSPSPVRRPRRRTPPWKRTTRLPGPERRDVMFFEPKGMMPDGANPNMSAEERDERTIFILQLARDTRPTDLEDFFSSVGNVRDVRIITDSRTGRSKGIAYVEFWDRESVALALGLNKQKLLGAPLIIQPSGAERNRQAAQTLGGALGFSTTFSSSGPMKLIVENLHPDINDKMLMEIFEPFGKVSLCRVARDERRHSRGFANLCFRSAEDAKKVLEQMNGYEIAGRPLRIKIDEEEQTPLPPPQESDNARLDERMDLGPSGRMQLMTKLAQSSGVALPQQTRDMMAAQAANVPPFATQCFLLSNMFDLTQEKGSVWPDEVADDVIIECNQHGGVHHIFVDRTSKEGYVYVKCPTVLIAHNCVTALHGRFFAGKMITANYVPATSYHDLFPESRHSSMLLQPRRRV